MFFKTDKADDDDFQIAREQMVQRQIVSRGVKDERVLEAMRRIPRHMFVPDSHVQDAYRDAPLPIGNSQTISQPYIVASMTEHLELNPSARTLEIGTGCGYQTAVLANVVSQVYTVERIGPLLKSARLTLQKLGYSNIEFGLRDGSLGWPEAAPFDAIIVTAAAVDTPPDLIDQLAPNGRLVIPVGDADADHQVLCKYIKQPDGTVRRTSLYSVRFVPLKESTE